MAASVTLLQGIALLASLLFLIACRSPLGSPDRPVHLAVTATGDHAAAVTEATRLAAALSSRTGLAIEAVVPDRYVDVVLGMGDERIDVALAPILPYLLAHDAWGAEAVLAVERDGATEFRGAVFARPEVTDLAALAEATVAVPDLYSTSGYVLPAVLLEQRGVHPGEIAIAGSHAEVVRRVYAGEVDAGLAYFDARAELVAAHPDVQSRVTVLATTDPAPNEPVFVRGGLPADVRTRLVEGFVAVAGTVEGREALRALHGVTAVRPIADADYDGVRDALGALGKRIDEVVPGGGLVRLEQRRPKEPIPPLGG